MSVNWKTLRGYIFNIDTIVAVILIIFILYFIFTSKRKTYKFNFPALEKTASFESKKKKKSKKSKKKKAKLNKHEEECRRIFERIFKCTFKSVRPKWLKNPATKKNLELDGYNPDIITPKGKGLAFEYDGEQHAKFNPYFHKNGIDEFRYQVVKDNWKDQKCKERGVILIRIPHNVVFTDLERYIKMMLNRNNVITNQTPKEIFRNFNSGQNLYG